MVRACAGPAPARAKCPISQQSWSDRGDENTRAKWDCRKMICLTNMTMLAGATLRFPLRLRRRAQKSHSYQSSTVGRPRSVNYRDFRRLARGSPAQVRSAFPSPSPLALFDFDPPCCISIRDGAFQPGLGLFRPRVHLLVRDDNPATAFRPIGVTVIQVAL